MIVDKLEVPVDASELLEAYAYLRTWEGREETLPAALRAEVQRLVQANTPDELVETLVGREISIVLRPEVRAVLANLRALEA